MILNINRYSKYCTGCKSHLTLDSFNKNVRATDGLQNYCKPCKAKATRNWKNGILSGDFERMVAKQESKCAICEKHTDTLVIDHCHISNRIRNLLCRRCNGMLGMADESKLILQRAIEYIDSWEDTKE